MNIDANAQTGPPPAHRTGGAARNRTSGDTGTDAPGGANFLSMLQALAQPGAEPPTAPAHGAASPGSVADARATDEQPVTDATDASRTPPEPAVVQPAAAAPATPQTGAPLAQRTAGLGAGAAHGVAADAAAQADVQAGLAGSDATRAAQDLAMDADADAQGSGAALQDDDTRALQQASEAAASTRRGAAHAARAAKDQDAAPLRPLTTAQAGNPAASVVSMFEAGLAGLRAGPGGIRGHERTTTRSHAPDPAGVGFVAWSDNTPGSGGVQTANPVYAPTAATPMPSAALAQKMHYWVAGGVQSAGLQLDAFGGGAVDVRIAVKGDEAFVEFRTDQPQARKLLLDAMPQLKELLAGEGLLLSGGFVGDSAQHPADGGQARSDRFPGARTAAAPVQAGSVVPVAPTRMASGAAVDLFV